MIFKSSHKYSIVQRLEFYFITLVLILISLSVKAQSSYWECDYYVIGVDTSRFKNEVTLKYLNLDNYAQRELDSVLLNVYTSKSSLAGHIKLIGKLPQGFKVNSTNYVENVYVSDELVRSRYYLKSQVLDNQLLLSGLHKEMLRTDTLNRKFIPHDIEIREHAGIVLDGLIFNSLAIFGRYNQTSLSAGSIDITNSFIRKCEITGDQREGYLSFKNNALIEGRLHSLNLDELNISGNMIYGLQTTLQNTRKAVFARNNIMLSPVYIDELLSDSSFIQGNFHLSHQNTFMDISGDNVNTLYIEGNVVDSIKQYHNKSVFNNLVVRGSFNKILVSDNQLHSNLSLLSLNVSEKIDVLNNSFSSLSVGDISLVDIYVNIPFNQFKGDPSFFIYTSSNEFETNQGAAIVGEVFPYFGILKRELQDEGRFLKLIRNYSSLYRIAKENGDIASANELYSQLQSKYTARYGLLAESDNRLESVFRYRLNQVLEFYVSYGTNPARAILISFYIIVLFTVVYFFFPSEWDKKSIQELRRGFRAVLMVNQKSKFRLVLHLIWFLLLGFFNAFTLSLNSFVTLGFGQIPTYGVARYVCIIEGFLGWFLLSLFSVALINQVIF